MKQKLTEYKNLDKLNKVIKTVITISSYDLYRGHLKSVAGYAPVKGMCSATRSCTINEGLDFGAVFVITHEMGHRLVNLSCLCNKSQD